LSVGFFVYDHRPMTADRRNYYLPSSDDEQKFR
jgi:hypothetical protein